MVKADREQLEYPKAEEDWENGVSDCIVLPVKLPDDWVVLPLELPDGRWVVRHFYVSPPDEEQFENVVHSGAPSRGVTNIQSDPKVAGVLLTAPVIERKKRLFKYGKRKRCGNFK
ncbi:hypothetical protein ScPMuIL_009071 [Solemya velum]